MALTKIKADGLTADLIDETKLADNSIDSEHYNDGSIDEAHIADDAVTTDKLASNISLGELAVTGDVHFNSNTNAGKDVYWDESASELQFSDTTYATFGAGKDLKIYHDGSNNNSYIKEEGAGNLYIYSENLRIMSADGSEAYIEANSNGNVELFYDNAKRWETTSTGVKSTGNIDVSAGHVYIDDVYKLKCGNDEDLNIWHDGSHAYIQNTTGDLYIQPKSGENAISAVADGAVSLFHNNSKKFETTSTGVQVTGNIDIDGNIDAADDSKIKLGTGDDLIIYHDGLHNYITSIASRNLNIGISGSGTYLQLASDGIFWSHHHSPWSNDTYDLGHNGAKWDDIYATNGTIQTSDKNEKNTIVDTDLGLSFVNKLKPVSYKFNGKTRTHYGLIAQDVETTLSDISKSTTDFAGFIKEDLPDQLYTDRDTIPEGKKEGDVKTPARTTYGLRYNEFISPLIKAVQELSAKVETLETKVAALEAG